MTASGTQRLDHLHSDPLELLLDIGLIGVVVWAVCLLPVVRATLIRGWWMQRRQQHHQHRQQQTGGTTFPLRAAGCGWAQPRAWRISSSTVRLSSPSDAKASSCKRCAYWLLALAVPAQRRRTRNQCGAGRCCWWPPSQRWLWPAWQQWRSDAEVTALQATLATTTPRAGRSLAEKKLPSNTCRPSPRVSCNQAQALAQAQTQNRTRAKTKPNVPLAEHNLRLRLLLRTIAYGTLSADVAAPYLQHHFAASAAQGGLYQPQWWVDRARWLQLRQQHKRAGDQHDARRNVAPALTALSVAKTMAPRWPYYQHHALALLAQQPATAGQPATDSHAIRKLLRELVLTEHPPAVYLNLAREHLGDAIVFDHLATLRSDALPALFAWFRKHAPLDAWDAYYRRCVAAAGNDAAWPAAAMAIALHLAPDLRHAVPNNLA